MIKATMHIDLTQLNTRMACGTDNIDLPKENVTNIPIRIKVITMPYESMDPIDDLSKSQQKISRIERINRRLQIIKSDAVDFRASTTDPG